MNAIEKALQALNPPVSPLPDSETKKALKFAISQAMQVPEDFYRSSPPGDLINRISIGNKYDYSKNNPVPYNVQLENNLDTAKHGAKGAIEAAMIGLGARPFTQSNPHLGEQLKLIGNVLKKVKDTRPGYML
jgi:hypothetical protein